MEKYESGKRARTSVRTRVEGKAVKAMERLYMYFFSIRGSMALFAFSSKARLLCIAVCYISEKPRERATIEGQCD